MPPRGATRQRVPTPSAARVAAVAVVSVLALLVALGFLLQSAVEVAAPAQETRTILVTGSTDGLGRAVAVELARTGAHVIVHGRNEERGRAVVDSIAREGIGSARFYGADLASFAEVRRFAALLRADYDRLDVLVNNAAVRSAERRVSADGHELQFQVNYLSHYLLTHELVPLLVASAPARVVNVASRTQRPIDFDDPMQERGYDDGQAYAQSKLAQIMFTFDLAAELEGTGVTVNAVHPAEVMNTTLLRHMDVQPQSTIAEGAASVVHAVTAPDLGTGRYFYRTEEARALDQAYDPAARARLRELSRRLTGAGGG